MNKIILKQPLQFEAQGSGTIIGFANNWLGVQQSECKEKCKIHPASQRDGICYIRLFPQTCYSGLDFTSPKFSVLLMQQAKPELQEYPQHISSSVSVVSLLYLLTSSV